MAHLVLLAVVGFAIVNTALGEESQPPDKTTTLAATAYAAFSKGDHGAARTGYLEVIKLAPENVNALVNLGIIAHQARNYSEAEQYLLQALRVRHDLPLAWLVRGIIAYDQHQLEAAHAHFAQAVLYAPQNAEARHYLGVTMGRKFWFDAAEEQLKKAVELAPDFAEAHYNLAMFYMERTPAVAEAAKRHYRLALDYGANPDSALARRITKLLAADEKPPQESGKADTPSRNATDRENAPKDARN